MDARQEREVLGLVERVARLEDFSRRVTGVLSAAGQALELGKLVADGALPPLVAPIETVVRRLYDHGHSSEETGDAST